MTKTMNREATERLAAIRNIITNLHFANKLTREEEATKRELEAEYKEITNKYDVETVYVAKAYDCKANKWITLGERATREEARELFATTTHYHKDIINEEICYNK